MTPGEKRPPDSYYDIVGYLTKAVFELQQEVAELKKQTLKPVPRLPRVRR
jgi:hypothetical protein